MTIEQQIDALKEQVTYWQSEAMGNASTINQEALRRAFRLTPSEAWIVANLHELRGKMLTKTRILDDMPGNGDRQDDRMAPNNRVYHIRKAMGRDIIDTIRGIGYRMTDKGIALCDAALGVG